jgi:hypothetical protein
MKVSKTNLEFMQNSIEKMIEYSAKKQNVPINKNLIDSFTISDKFYLWAIVYNNIKYYNDNANVYFIDGKRLFEQNSNFEYYIDDTNDKTIETALNFVFNNISKKYNIAQ